jgi:hypothetical protein
MESQICISKNSVKSEKDDLILNIKYIHPEFTLTINSDEYYSYSYTGTINNILESNNITDSVNAEYFINGLKNTNYLSVSENTTIIGFPLQVNYIENTVKIVCNVQMHTDQNYIIKKVSEKLTTKIIELDNKNQILTKNHKFLELKVEDLELKVEELELKVEDLEKHKIDVVHLDETLEFDGEPLIFNDRITSLTLTIATTNIKNDIVLPQHLLNFKMTNSNNMFNLTGIIPIISFPITLVKFNLVDMCSFDQFIDFKNMPNLKHISLILLKKFNHPINIHDNIETVIIKGLPMLNQVISIPDSKSIKFVKSDCIRETVMYPIINDHNGYVNNGRFSIKCFSQNDEVVKYIANNNRNGGTRNMSFLSSKEKMIRDIYKLCNTFPTSITFF